MTNNENLLKIEDAVLAPLISKPGRNFEIVALALGTIFAWGLFTWAWQIAHGLMVTGLGVPVFWGVYIINFVFFIGISHAGTLISSILRIIDAEWRRPFTRMAESITIASLFFAVSCVIIDLGRPDRLFNVILYAHLTSPLLWDVICISTYLTVSCVYFYLALIPDLALCRDRLTQAAPWLRAVYRLAAMGWMGTMEEEQMHQKLMTALSVVLLALVISVHTNVGFVFGMTLKPGWHTALIGPYFVIGAALQGLGILASFAVVIRNVFHMEWAITEHELNCLRRFFLAICCFWAYFTFAEFLTTFYGQQPAEMAIFWSKINGQFSGVFWLMISCCFFIPFLLLAFRFWTLENRLFLAGIITNIGMWLERYTIIVPSGARPYLPWGFGHYTPSWAEISITAAWISGFVLVFLILTRFIPMLTIWELKESSAKIIQQEI
ncbi:MAG: NrfD/PsrC family molybdoenzyme membrane anchor subunit [Elusimicrobiota bacterium]